MMTSWKRWYSVRIACYDDVCVLVYDDVCVLVYDDDVLEMLV